jgi:hypothetical protein
LFYWACIDDVVHVQDRVCRRLRRVSARDRKPFQRVHLHVVWAGLIKIMRENRDVKVCA